MNSWRGDCLKLATLLILVGACEFGAVASGLSNPLLVFASLFILAVYIGWLTGKWMFHPFGAAMAIGVGAVAGGLIALVNILYLGLVNGYDMVSGYGFKLATIFSSVNFWLLLVPSAFVSAVSATLSALHTAHITKSTIDGKFFRISDTQNE